MASTRRPGLGLNIRTSTAQHEHTMNVLRAAAPWATWLSLPLAGTAFWGLDQAQGGDVVPYLLHGGTAVVPWFVWRLRRRRFGRKYLTMNAFAAMAWVDYLASNGWTWTDASVWAVGGAIGCVLWAIWHSTHKDEPGEIFAAVDGPAAGPKQKKVDWSFLIRLITGRVPVIRSAAEAVGQVVPVVTTPWREPLAVASGGAAGELTAGAQVADDAVDLAKAKEVTEAFAVAYRKWTVSTHPALNGTRVKWEKIRPWRATGLLIGRPGVHEPEDFMNVRGKIASLSRAGKDRFNVRPNLQDNSQARIDLVLKDVLKSTPWWEPPTAFGGSVADGGIVVGVFEDGMPLAIMQPAKFKKLPDGRMELVHNLSHLGVEGMTGSGKSTFARILIAQDFALDDVEDWAIDTAKGMQTLGPLAPGLPWFVTKTKEAQKMVSWLVNQVIPARATYLARKGLDNWHKGCGLPFLRVLIEEAAVVANELGDLVKLANLARSAGVALILSFQRAHHGLIDTNVRAALGSTMSFGQKSFGDCFMLDEDVAAAGADPSIWRDKHPGKCFAQLQGFDVERMLTHARSFRVDTATLTEYCGVRGPQHIAELERAFPEWYALLRTCDTRGVYENRQTGAKALAALGAPAAASQADPPPHPVESDRPAPLRLVESAPHDGAEPEDTEPEDTPMTRDYQMTDGSDARHLATGDPIEPEQMEETVRETLEEDDLSDEVRQELGELLTELEKERQGGEAVAPDAEINVFVHPDEMLDFSRPDDSERGLPRAKAAGYIVQYLAHKGVGWQFTPAGLHEETRERVGKSAGWTRGEVRRLAEIGAVAYAQDDPDAKLRALYEVTTKIHDLAAPAPAPAT